ncbi:site-specific integrase [Nocardiopsis dassonvillei]
MAVYDRWHKSQAAEGDTPCREHKQIPSSEHGVGDRWQVRWRDEFDRQRKRNFPKKSGKDPEVHAEAFDAKLKANASKGLSVDTNSSNMLLRDYGALWRSGAINRASTTERMESIFRLHIDPILGHFKMSQVRASHVRAWIKDRSTVLAPSTLRVAYSYVTALFSWAVVDRAIEVSPCKEQRLPEVGKHDHYIPTPDQVHGLAGRLPARYSGIAYLGAGCGLRGGEIFGLELDAIDFERREIDVRQQLIAVTGRKPFLGPPKTKTSARTVELPEVASEALRLHLERFAPVEVEIEDETDPHKPRRRKVKLVFLWGGATGGFGDLTPIHRANWSHAWSPAARAVGIPKGVGLHCLRHYFATLLIHEGASVKTVQMALGHSTPTVTLNTYVGEWPEAQDRTRALVDNALGLVPRMCPPR